MTSFLMRQTYMHKLGPGTNCFGKIQSKKLGHWSCLKWLEEEKNILTRNGDSQTLPLKYDLVPCGVLNPDTEPLPRPLLPRSSSPPFLRASRRKRLSEEG